MFQTASKRTCFVFCVSSRRSEATTPDSVTGPQLRPLPTASEDAKEFLQSLGKVHAPNLHASSSCYQREVVGSIAHFCSSCSIFIQCIDLNRIMIITDGLLDG